MQVGIITVDGRQVGVVNFSTDGPDNSMSLVPSSGLESPSAPDGNISMGRHSSGRQSAGEGPKHNSIRYGHHKSEAKQREEHKHNSIRYGHHKPESETQPSRIGKVSVSKGEDPRGMEANIRASAIKYHHDPDTAVAVAKSEGLQNYVGDHGKSFGAFQLYKGGGLGNEFQKETGLDPSNPSNEKAMIDWSMKNLDRTGWGPYHGAHNRYGLGNREGIGTGATHTRASEAGKSINTTGSPVDRASAEGLMASPGRNPNLSRVDPRLREIMSAAATHLPPGYKMGVNEGYNAHGHAPHSQHKSEAGALDVQIFDPNGNPIPNRGRDTTGMYTRLGRAAYGEMQARHPELEGKFAHGSSFGTSSGSGVADLMHFDLGGERGHLGPHLSQLGPLRGETYGNPKPQKTADNEPNNQGP